MLGTPSEIGESPSPDGLALDDELAQWRERL